MKVPFPLLILVVCQLMPTFGIANAGSFENPSSTTDARIAEIQENLLKLQSQYFEIATAVASGAASFQDIKPRLSVLENLLHRLEQQLLDGQRESDATNGKYVKSISQLFMYYNNLDTQLKALQATLAQKEQDEAKRRLPMDIAEKILGRQFGAAQLLLIKMKDTQKIPLVIHYTYANAPGNANTILDFAKALDAANLTFYVISGLRYEMQANGHRDPYKMIAMANILDSKILKGKSSDDLKAQTQKLYNETKTDIINASVETLKAAMYSDRYQKNVQVEILAAALAGFRFDVSDEVMKQVAIESYPTVPADKIADNFNSNKDNNQIVSGLTALFWKMKSAGDHNNNGILKIAEYFHRLIGVSLRAEKTNDRNIVINTLPTCAKNLFFSKEVCIWNLGKREYLYSASDQYKFNGDNRRVLTWNGGSRVNQGFWNVQKVGNQFQFINTRHANEKLYSRVPQSRDNRFVFTTSGDQGRASAWNVELEGEFCYLRNEESNEYLYASNSLYMRDRRYPFTYIPKGDHKSEIYQWQIQVG